MSKWVNVPGIWIDSNTVVMYIEGSKYKVTVDVKYDDYGMPVDAEVLLEPTTEPTASPDTTKTNRHFNYGYKFGGYPRFIQNECHPHATDDMKPYAYICTIENGWGDSGNGNVFVLIRNGVVEDVFVEASCC